MIVYKITNTLNRKIYIGQTVQSLNNRWKQHLRDSKKDLDFPIYRAIKKYGPENFRIEEIDGANSLSELNYLETHYIHRFDSLVIKNGYNILVACKNFRMPDSIKDKISKALKGKKKYNTLVKKKKVE